MKEALQRWDEWAKECFSKDQSPLKPRIEQITDQERGKDNTDIPESLIEIRHRASLTRIIAEEPDTETWINQAYAEQDIGVEIRNLANRGSHGNDGIPGEA